MKLILGPPGGGKSEISQWLIQEFNMVHINIGSIIKKEAGKDPILNKMISNYELIHFNIIQLLLDKELNKYKKKGIDISRILLENYPFTLESAIKLDPIEYKIDHVIWCDVRVEDITYRISKRDFGNNYDSDLIAKTRYQYWYDKSLSIKNYYEKIGLLRLINIEQPRFEIRRSIRKQVFDISLDDMPIHNKEKFIKVYCNSTETESSDIELKIINYDFNKEYDDTSSRK